MAKTNQQTKAQPETTWRSLWELGIMELTGQSLEATNRDDVNQMLQDGWVLLHIYTLKYPEDDVWRERPMAILGKPSSAKRRRQHTAKL